MTSVALTRLWINRLDSGEAVSAQAGRDGSQTFTDGVEVSTLASGRQRAISVVGERGTVIRTLTSVTLATVTLLRTWKGIAVQLRDHRGQKWYGVFGEVQIIEHMPTTEYSVQISLRTITQTEGV